MNGRLKRDRLFIVPVGLVASALVLSAEPKVPSKGLNFNHNQHLQAGLNCADCHSGVQTLPAGGRAMPDHKICADCHNTDDGSSCVTCHADPDNPTAYPGAGAMFSGFAHQTHSAAGLSCEICHGDAATAAIAPKLPMMPDCQSCHFQSKGPLNCEQCHAGDRPLPTDHKMLTWKQEHGVNARLAISDCAGCHSQQSCDDCHQGVNLAGTPHPVTWKFNHFTASAMGAECISCHTTRQFCTDCHRTTRPIPHPVGVEFANSVSGGSHKDEARSFPETCLSCHDLGAREPICAKCHR